MSQNWRDYELLACEAHREATGHDVFHWSNVGDDLLVACGFIHSHNEMRLKRQRAREEGHRAEYGLDGIALDKVSNIHHGIQAKLRSSGYLTASDLGTFVNVIEYRLVKRNFHSKGYLYTNSKLQIDLRDDLLNGGRIHIVRLQPVANMDIQDGSRVNMPSIALRPYQVDAVRALAQGWKGFGALILPCGVGKTAVFLEHSKCYDKVLILSPLCASAMQNLVRARCVLGHSYTSLLVDSDGGEATRDPASVHKAWQAERVLVSCTYASAKDVVAEAILQYGLDASCLVIVDEAHNATAEMLGLLRNCQRVLLSTATPAAVLADANDSDNETHSSCGEVDSNEDPVLTESASLMTELWSKQPIYRMTFAEAIEGNWITDYRIYLPLIEGTCTDTLGMQSRFLLDGMLRTGAKRMIVYCTSQRECFEVLAEIRSVAKTIHGIDEGLWTGCIISDVPASRREAILREFESDAAPLDAFTYKIIASVRILDEAIDLPRCDSVCILHPSSDEGSWRRMVQRISRAVRLDESNPGKMAHVFLWLPRDAEVPRCLSVLREYDPLFVQKVRVQSFYAYEEGGAVQVAREIELTRIAQQYYAVRCMSYEDLREMKVNMLCRYFVIEEKWPGQGYIDGDTSFKLGIFLNNLRQHPKRLTAEQRARLEERDPTVLQKSRTAAKKLPMNQKVTMLLQFHDDNNGRWPAQSYVDSKTTFRLGEFLIKLRQHPKRLTVEQRARLEGRDSTVLQKRRTVSAAVQDLSMEDKVTMLLQFHKDNKGKWPARNYVDSATTFKLGRFLHNLRQHPKKLTADQRSRLEERDPAVLQKSRTAAKELSKNDKVTMLLQFHDDNNGRWPAQGYVDSATTFKLGIFLCDLRQHPKKLTADQRSRLEERDPVVLQKSRTAAKELSKDDKVTMLLQFHDDNNGRWPAQGYVDSATTFKLGRFLHNLRWRPKSLTTEQRSRLEERDSDVLANRKRKALGEVDVNRGTKKHHVD